MQPPSRSPPNLTRSHQPNQRLNRPRRSRPAAPQTPAARAPPSLAPPLAIRQQIYQRGLQLRLCPAQSESPSAASILATISRKFSYGRPITTGTPNCAGSSGLCPPLYTRLPPTNATSAVRYTAARSPIVSSSTISNPPATEPGGPSFAPFVTRKGGLPSLPPAPIACSYVAKFHHNSIQPNRTAQDVSEQGTSISYGSRFTLPSQALTLPSHLLTPSDLSLHPIHRTSRHHNRPSRRRLLDQLRHPALLRSTHVVLQVPHRPHCSVRAPTPSTVARPPRSAPETAQPCPAPSPNRPHPHTRAETTARSPAHSPPPPAPPHARTPPAYAATTRSPSAPDLRPQRPQIRPHRPRKIQRIVEDTRSAPNRSRANACPVAVVVDTTSPALAQRCSSSATSRAAASTSPTLTAWTQTTCRPAVRPAGAAPGPAAAASPARYRPLLCHPHQPVRRAEHQPPPTAGCTEPSSHGNPVAI